MGNKVDNKAPKFTTKRGNTYYINVPALLRKLGVTPE